MKFITLLKLDALFKRNTLRRSDKWFLRTNLEIHPYRGTGTHTQHLTCIRPHSGRAGGHMDCCPHICQWIYSP